MPRSLEDWRQSLQNRLSRQGIQEGKAKGLSFLIVKGTTSLQKEAPRGKFKRVVSAKNRGFRTLFQSFKSDANAAAGTAHITTDHPGAATLDEGRTIVAKKRFLMIAFKAFNYASKDFYAVPIGGGRRAVLSTKGKGGIFAVFTPSVTIRATHWRDKAEKLWLSKATDEEAATLVLDV